MVASRGDVFNLCKTTPSASERSVVAFISGAIFSADGIFVLLQTSYDGGNPKKAP